MNQTTKNLYAYADIISETKAPITHNFALTLKARTRRSQRAGRTNMVKAALKKLFPMEMHLAEKRRIG